MKLNIIMIITCSVIILGIIGFSVIYSMIKNKMLEEEVNEIIRKEVNATLPKDIVDRKEPVLIELWHLDEQDGSTTVADSAPAEFNNVGRVMGNVRFVPGVKGNAADFTTPDSSIIFSRFGGDGMKMKDAATIEGWVYLRDYPSESDGYYLLFGSRQHYNDKYLLVKPNGLVVFPTYQKSLDADGARLWSISKIPLNGWTHVAGTLNRISDNTFEKKIYINGKLDALASWTIDEGTDLDFNTGFVSVYIGSDVKDGYPAINGMIDEVIIWSVAKESFVS